MQSRDYQLQSLLYSNPEAQVSVYLATIAQGSQEVVIKQTVHGYLEEANATINEAMTQAKLEHQHICKILDCFLEQTPENTFKSVLVLERMVCDLGAEIKRRRLARQYWSEWDLLQCFHQLLSALCFAQNKGISHRDIKPQNVFLSQEGVLKLGDFGSAFRQAALNQLMGVQGTPLFLSPELKQFYAANLSTPLATPSCDPFQSDVYSLGVTFLYMAILEPPNGLTDTYNLAAVTEQILTSLQYPNFVPLLRMMLEIDPQRRATLEGLKKYVEDWINSLGSAGYQGDTTGAAHQLYHTISENAYQGRGQTESVQPLSQTVRPVGNLEQSSYYPQNSGMRSDQSTVPTYQCSWCSTPFIYSSPDQVCGEGYYLCSEQCKAASKAGYSQCFQCNTSFRNDETWWPNGKQQYPEYTEHFRYFCSMRCLATCISIQPKPITKIQCVWCQVEVVATSLRDTTAVQLSCLHLFHDIDCVINYIGMVSEDFRKTVTFVCPKCGHPVPGEVVTEAIKRHNTKEKQQSRLCHKCNAANYTQVFECQHKLCKRCTRVKSVFMFFTDEVCSICPPS